MSDFEMAVGDLNSDERGSGARANGGKPPYKYIPCRALAEIIDAFDKMNAEQEMGDNPDAQLWWYREYPDEVAMLKHLAAFEEGKTYKINEAAGAYLYRPGLLDEVTKVFEFGAKKYAPFNWAKGMPWSVPLECIKRHAKEMCLHGKWRDDESGLSHAAHIGCNLVMLLW